MGVLGGATKALAGFSLVAGAAFIGATVGVVKLATDFQDLTTQLVTGAGESASNLELVRKGLLSLSGEVAQTPEELAKGMYMIESAGYHGAAGLAVLKASAEGAKVGGADMATVANAVTSGLNAYGLQADKASLVTNVLVSTVAAGKMHMEDLAGSLGHVLPAAAASHVSIQEVGAAMATMTSQGTDAASAATYLRQTILNIEAPSGKAKKALQDIGLSSTEVGNSLQKNGLAPTLSLITDHLKKVYGEGTPQYIAAMSAIVGGAKSMQGVLELTGPHMQTFRDNLKNISGTAAQAGNSIQGWDKIQGDFGFKLDAFKDKMLGVATGIGMQLLPVLGKVLDAITKGLSPAMDAISNGAGPILGKVFEMLGKFLAALLPILKGLWDALMAIVPVVWPIVDALGTALVGAIKGIAAWVANELVPKLESLAKSFKEHVLPAVKTVIGIFTALIGPMQAVGEFIIGTLINAVKWVSDHFNILGPILLIVAGAFVAIETAMKIQVLFGVLAGVVGTATLAFSALGAVLGGEMTAGEAAAAMGAEGLGAALDTALGPIGLIILAVVAVIAIGVLLVTHWQQVKDMAGKVGGAIKDFFVGAFNRIKDAISDVINWFKDFPQHILDALKALPGLLLDLGKKLLEGLWTGIQIYWKIITTFWGTIGSLILTALKALPGLLVDLGGKLIGGLWTGITEGFKLVITLITGIPGLILDLLKDLGSLLLDLGGKLLGGLVTGLTQVLPQVLLFFVELPFKIVAGLAWIAVFLVAHGIRLLVGLVQGLINALPQVINWFKALPGHIWDAIKNIATWLVDNGVKLITGLVNGIASIEHTIWDWFTALPGKLWNLLKAAPGWLVDTGVKIVNGLLQGIHNIEHAIWDWIKALPGNLWNLLKAAATWLVGTGANIISGLLSGIGSAANSVWNWFTSLPGTIWGYFKDVGSWLYNIGKWLIDGLMNGIKKGWDAVTGFFHDAPGHIADFFKSALGIGSPSRVFHGFGINIMEGLHNGLTSQMPTLTQKLKGITDTIANTKMPALTASLATQLTQTLTTQAIAMATGSSSVVQGPTAGTTYLGSGTNTPSAGGVQIHIDMNGAQLLSDRGMEDFIRKLGTQFVGKTLAASGVNPRR